MGIRDKAENNPMSVSDQLEHLQELSRRFLRDMVETPVHHLFGRHRSAGHTAGASPGTLFISSDAAATEVRLWQIGPDGVKSVAAPEIDTIREMHEREGRLWLDVCGFSDDDMLRQIGELFNLHPMILADLVNVERQTKVDSDDQISLILMQVPQLAGTDRQPGLGQLGLVLMDDVVLSFREVPGPLFDPVVARLDRPTSHLRSHGPDYLASALLDVAVEASFPVVETLADQIDEIETDVMESRGQDVMATVHHQRRALIALGRLFRRQRDLMARLLRDDEIFSRPTHIYLRDVYDRTVQLLDMTDTLRELAGSLVEIHLSISANRSNEIMRTLTIMASIFIPLTFVAGVYGMNFEWMPELAWPWGYPAVLGVMLAVSLGLLWWFHRRGWLVRRG
jgi:magnesium transporter